MASHQKKTKRLTCNVYYLVFLFYALTIFLAVAFLSHAKEGCERQRKIHRDTYGVISSGGKQYAMDSHCEWLIKANDSRQFISLTFTKMDTECSYDHVFVYDGDSYESPLLGSFSGNTTPSTIIARNGAMLILLYSDTNYVRTGFEAFYTITDCPLNCSEKGVCIDHHCICDSDQTGESCSINLCPNDCGEVEGKGECMEEETEMYCRCHDGFTGFSCSLPDTNKNGGFKWHMVSPDGFPARERAGHIGIYVENVDTFYVFGGYTLNKVHGDIFAFVFSQNKWVNLTKPGGPSPRRHHAAAPLGNNFVVFGGELENGSLSNELWLFNTTGSSWQLLKSSGSFHPPPLSKHSLTLVEESSLYVFGGTYSNHTFSSDMYKAVVRGRGVMWEKVITRAGKQSVRRLVGHTVIYYPQAKSLFIHGGVTVEHSHVSKLSYHMYAFHVEELYWTQINFMKDKNMPLERAFHTAALAGDYMILYGGYTHRHAEEEICYDNETYMYHLQCQRWVNLKSLLLDHASLNDFPSTGVFSHVMGIRRGHTVLIHGGYSGVMHSALIAYILPPTMVTRQRPWNPCGSHITSESCLANLACLWCPEQGMCLERKHHMRCDDMVTDNCPGICPVLGSCTACLVWGDPEKVNAINDDAILDNFPIAPCVWLVQAALCLPIYGDRYELEKDESVGPDVYKATGKDTASTWWGPNQSILATINQCYTRDFPPGLVSARYRHPINWSQPDSVTRLRQASEELYFRSDMPQNSSRDVEENAVKFIAYLHPLGAKPKSERITRLQLDMCFNGLRAVLKLSNDSTMRNLDVVANQTAKSSFSCFDVQRHTGGVNFPNLSLGYKYLFDFTVFLSTDNESANMQLRWNAFSIQRTVISDSYLEPYNNGTCDIYSNCLACLTDTACGWCKVGSRCISRYNVTEGACQMNGQDHFLVTHPSGCIVCSDYSYCEQCVEDDLCEWLVEAAYCVRRGRYPKAVQSIATCPVPCHMRNNCSSCLGDPGVCAWCESKKTCFLFSTYTTSYMYGQCRDWVDENRSQPNTNPVALCRDCSKHKECKQCLQDLNCGWCSSSANPLLGACVGGDFSGVPDSVCIDALKREHNMSKEQVASPQWSYGVCPDIEECLLGLHDCHENATCKNTLESYICECNVGFKGDGRTCVRACSVECVHGHCSGAPDYKCICNLGWTALDCGTDCGCYNHSTCAEGPGICSDCKNLTEGEFCERCRPGTYGSAVTDVGCKKCNCNGHGNAELGYCNGTTGACFCEDNTEGSNCTRCAAGYFGNPRNGGDCFEECRPRGILTEIVSGRLGSSGKTGPTSDCLWLLTVYPHLDVESLLGPMPSTDAIIELTIHKGLKIPCPHNHLYVYDGLPDFVAAGHPNTLLGSFCGTNLSKPIVVSASSGYMTIHFKHNGKEEHFKASYRRIENFFSENQTCTMQHCRSSPLYLHSETEVCPNNCSVSQNHGVCDTAYGKCICENGHGGDDCSVVLKPSYLLWTSLYSYEQTVELTIDTPSARTGHTLLAVNNESTDFENLWLFGGYSPATGDMKDMYMFETFRRQWMKVETEKPSPSARHLHACASHKEFIYIYGGMDTKHVFGDFWEFNTVTGSWTHLKAPDDFPRVGSTLTAVRGGELYLIGGFSAEYGFFEKVMMFDLSDKEWYPVNCSGAQPIGIYGHSAVYHYDTGSIYVFGGIEYDVDSVIISSHLYAFQYSTAQWFRLPADVHVNPVATRPQPRYFHSSVVTKNYMIIAGGRSSFTGNDIEPVPYAYVFSCNVWISLTGEDIEIVGKPPKDFVAGAAAMANGDAYLFGGDGGELKKLSLPVDLCQLFSSSRVRCILHTGCAFCSVFENGMNQTFCYSQVYSIPPSCYNPKVSSEVVPAVSCNSEWIEKRDCSQYSTCTDCVAAWPAFSAAKQVCHWCSNCKVGRCASIQTSCENENDCNISHKVINQTSMCPIRMCWASDCEKCLALGSCIWTRQVQRSSGFGHMLNQKPIYNWICVMKEVQDAPPFPIKSMPPLKCPSRCSQYRNCTSCLQSSGGEGGWHQCVWSIDTQTCMSPSFELLRCEEGSCGAVLMDNASLCPLPCWKHEQASHCLAHAHCGWCAFTGPLVDGRGLCMEGGIMGPTGGICRENQVILLGAPLPGRVGQLFASSWGPPKWAYLSKPPENECRNGHHTCDERHQVCVDTLDGFECDCKPGYELKSDGNGGDECKPICKQGCVNGTCIRPDDCKCNFGYVGKDCSIACKCNGHSHCPGPDALDICPDCQNNTQGPHCQKCKPLFVGNPVNGGKCIPCHIYCHGHSSICLNSDLLVNNGTIVQQYNQSFMNDLIEKLTEGAYNDAVCMDCQNNTEGKRCDQCVSGYFKAGETFEEGCRPCECHGHGDTCNPFNGEGCNCQNNTENDRQCSQKNSKNIITPCWQLQCSKCKEYFLGAPVHGHQCYRHMFLDKDYCFDPNTHDECTRTPSPLLQGRTVYFAVQPRYMNVDIRIVVDVTEGAVDFLLSPKEDTFIVQVNKTTGVHYVSVDKKYGEDLRSEFEFVYYGDPSAGKIRKRDVATEATLREYLNATESRSSSSMYMREANAKDLTTYITVKKRHEFLVVRNLKNRLVITVPQEVHDLRSTRFYMILRGVGTKQLFSTYGNLFFRQDQTRIDLFVFFSVFFSCFFLFLAGCVVVWKVKQAFDVRRARRLHAAEMKHMASRPFARIITVVEDDPDDSDFPFYSPTNCRKKMKHNNKVYGRDSPKSCEERFCLRPIAVEPLANNNAAVATILVQLPGGANSLVRMTLASALITARSSHYYVGCGIRAAMRRRTSHVNV